MQRWLLSFLDSLTSASLPSIQVWVFPSFIDQRSKEFACVEAMTTFQAQDKNLSHANRVIFSLLASPYFPLEIPRISLWKQSTVTFLNIFVHSCF